MLENQSEKNKRVTWRVLLMLLKGQGNDRVAHLLQRM